MLIQKLKQRLDGKAMIADYKKGHRGIDPIQFLQAWELQLEAQDCLHKISGNISARVWYETWRLSLLTALPTPTVISLILKPEYTKGARFHISKTSNDNVHENLLRFCVSSNPQLGRIDQKCVLVYLLDCPSPISILFDLMRLWDFLVELLSRASNSIKIAD